ncbi:YciI family protein [Dyadobacter sp. NIV53]|uniref:YciI family protein n=1 Tax=Dyadobacter sp. NIV53 TaxID=2861765 RepID=UPI001C87AFA5|nr:YciI family protein [Dyadobacter sp. NIV53]
MKVEKMNEFLLVFRSDYDTKRLQLSAGEMHTYLKCWDDWLDYLAAQNILARPFQSLDDQGMILNPNHTMERGPYFELKESITGLIVIKAMNYEEALKIAQDCPILEVGGNVEIRLGN